MKIIGLTGSIGMGKSATAALLRSLRVPVFDSDACVRNLLDGKALQSVARRFPEATNPRTRKIDRTILGQIVFHDTKAKAELEAILHPLVWEEQQRFLLKARKDRKKCVVLDIPLLFETGRNQICDKVICVTAPPFLQKQRVLRRKGMSPQRFHAILAGQMTDHEKRLRADMVLPTGLGRGYVLQKLKSFLKCL